MLNKPYYRIVRPKTFIPEYVLDPRYASDRLQLGRAYLSVEQKLRKTFEYIEPAEDNKIVFSLELYSILLRACTEVELNCKTILKANRYKKTGDMSISDYVKLERSSCLSKYKVKYLNWRASNGDHVMKEFTPFASFASGNSPQWYKDYNDVKHNREAELPKANLLNCMEATAGILVLLYSQFGSRCIETYGSNGLYFRTDDEYDFPLDADVIFTLDAPGEDDWPLQEQYDFQWGVLKSDPEPFTCFQF